MPSPDAPTTYPFLVPAQDATRLREAFATYAATRQDEGDLDALCDALDDADVNLRAIAAHNPDLDPLADGIVNYEPGPLTISRLTAYVARNIEYRMCETWDAALTTPA